MTKYQKYKERARQLAIDYQYDFEKLVHSYSELALYTEYFRKLAKNYGLTKEFIENGII